MPLLKAKSKREGHRYIGMVVAPWIYEYLNLYTVAHAMHKSDVYKDLVEDWITRERLRNTDDVLLQKIVDRIKESIPQDMGLKEYKESIYKELRKGGLKESYINLVLSKI